MSQNKPEMVIKNCIKYEDRQNINKLTSCFSDNYRLSDESIESIKNVANMKLIDLKLVNNESIYNAYIHNGRGTLIDNLSRDDVRIYNVKYYIKYKDDTKSVDGSGEYSKMYFLIKESNTQKWKIDDIGQ